jgi:hypothetical protein
MQPTTRSRPAIWAATPTKDEDMKFRKKPVVIRATQWFKNGDHPADYAKDTQDFEGGELRTFTGAQRRAKGWEGQVVRYFRRPDVDGHRACQKCGNVMHDHGWVDTLEGGHIVCPGDWIITGVKGEIYPCKPDIFAATYEPADDHGTAGIVAPAPNRELSFGEKAVGLTFNPGANPEVHACKAGFAVEIDRMNDLRNATTDNEVKRMASVAITELQTAQMWAVKAITWKS